MSVNQQDLDWHQVCSLADIQPNTGVCALLAGQQIAIFRIDDEQRVYALSNHDPFSGANVMSRGILGDIQGERVVASPIYKQHFSLATGRCLEDNAQHLNVYATKIIDKQVWVSTQVRKTLLIPIATSKKPQNLILVGNGLAGMRCLEELLAICPDMYHITVIAAETCGNYNRIMLSPMLAGEKSFSQILLHTPEWYQAKGIRLISGDAAVQIRRSSKQVLTASGLALPYDRLILATGAQPVIPQLNGNALHGVLSFRTIHDVEQMIERSQQGAHAVVIGAGVLGLEAAYGLKQRGMQVTLLHRHARIMERQLDQRASDMLKARIEAQGIHVITQVDTEEIIGQQGQVRAVRVADGRQFAADMVVFTVGIRPNISLALDAGLQCNRGILVSDTMQSFDPSIYAIGECVEHRAQLFGLVEPLWGQAYVCAMHLAERGQLSFKAVPTATQLKVSGIELYSAGVIAPEGDYEDIILYDEQRQLYKRLILQNNKVIGTILFGDSQDGAWYAELIAAQTSIQKLRHKLLFGRDFALKQVS